MTLLAHRLAVLAGLLSFCPVEAQDAPDGPPVVLEFLLERQRSFTADELRAAAKAAFDVDIPAITSEDAETFVTVKNGMGIVKVRGFMLVVHNPPIPRFEDRHTAAMVCRETAVAEAIRSHRGYATVMSIGDDLEPAQAYRNVARLGAGLLSANVLAVGFDGRDLFVAPSEDLATRLRSDDPQTALSARQGAGGNLLLASAGQPDTKALVAAVRSLVPDLPPEITTKEEGRRLAVTIDEVHYVLIARGGRNHIEKARNFHPDARSELLVLAEFDFDDKARLPRQQHCVAQILRHQAAARPAGDVLAFALLPEPGVRIPATELRMLDSDRAFVLAKRWANDPVFSVDGDDPAMRAAIDKARGSIARLRRLLATPEVGPAFVKYGFVEGKHTEHLWIRITSLTDKTALGTIGNDPVFLEKLRSGAAVEVNLAEISDWMCIVDGEREGGFTIAVLTARAEKVRSR